MALITKSSPQDFMSGHHLDLATYISEDTDIHHIFPQSYCSKQNYSSDIYDSVVNKTPIYAGTNRSIGGSAPSKYLQTMRNKGLTEEQIINAVSSHFINYELLKADDFSGFIADRATRLLDCIEAAMGKPRLLVAEKKNGRWYVYFKGVKPADNVGQSCKTAASALRYMFASGRGFLASTMHEQARHCTRLTKTFLVKNRNKGTDIQISNNVYERLRFEAAGGSNPPCRREPRRGVFWQGTPTRYLCRRYGNH